MARWLNCPGNTQKYEIHANMAVKWKREAFDGMKETLARKGKKTSAKKPT
jgi:hypothetical protein